jgi:uncharacterized protein (DUF4213/DUF364 family)
MFAQKAALVESMKVIDPEKDLKQLEKEEK